MAGILKPSTWISSNSRASRVLVFSAQSLRRSFSRARMRAAASLTRPRRWDPFRARASLRCNLANRFISRPDRPGTCSSSPVDNAADTATPRSTPTTDPSPGPTAGSGATANATCHRPARSRVIRQDFAATGTGRDQRNRTQPVFGTRTAPTWRDRRRTSLGCSCTIRNPSSRPALRHVGRRCVPAKKFVIAWAWSRIACCCTITLPSASHWLFSRAAVSCRHRSANRGIGPRPGRHQDSCSTHRFHTYLASAQCRSSATSSVRDG